MEAQLKKAALDFCEAVKELHPNLNMGKNIKIPFNKRNSYHLYLDNLLFRKKHSLFLPKYDREARFFILFFYACYHAVFSMAYANGAFFKKPKTI